MRKKRGRIPFSVCLSIYLSCCVFRPFLLILNLFQWFHSWNHWKTSENEQKTRLFVYSSKLVDMQIVVSEIEIRLQAPESWSKYTTLSSSPVVCPYAGSYSVFSLCLYLCFLFCLCSPFSSAAVSCSADVAMLGGVRLGSGV